MTVSLADRGRYWCSVDTGGAARGETRGDTLEYSLKLEVSSLLDKTENAEQDRDHGQLKPHDLKFY